MLGVLLKDTEKETWPRGEPGLPHLIFTRNHQPWKMMLPCHEFSNKEKHQNNFNPLKIPAMPMTKRCTIWNQTSLSYTISIKWTCTGESRRINTSKGISIDHDLGKLVWLTEKTCLETMKRLSTVTRHWRQVCALAEQHPYGMLKPWFFVMLVWDAEKNMFAIVDNVNATSCWSVSYLIPFYINFALIFIDITLT
jgi:hypothetical protein